MADAALIEHATDEWVPADNFGARLALVRQHMGWNVKEAAEACGVNGQSWHNWESGGSPRNMEQVCHKIAETARCNYVWLMTGGPLTRSRCFYVLPYKGQMEFAYDDDQPVLAGVG